MPRPPDQPQVQESVAENLARDDKTIGELYREAVADGQTDFGFEIEAFDWRAVVARVGPERWAELRRRRDELLAELQARREA